MKKLLLKKLIAISLIGWALNVQSQSIKYGFTFDLENSPSAEALHDISDDEPDGSGIAFSSDGSKVFVAGFAGNIHQYSLDVAYEVGSGVTYDGAYDASSQVTNTGGIAFNTSGTKMFLTGGGGVPSVWQYSLSKAFSIITGVTHDGSPLDVGSQEGAPRGMSFNADGSKLYIVGSGGREVNQYSLSTNYIVTSGVSHDGLYSISSQDTNPQGVAFSADGTRMFVLGFIGKDVNQYELSTPFDVTGTVSEIGTPFPVSDEETGPGDLTFNADGSKMYIVGFLGDEINQYDLNTGGFDETTANTGRVEGSLSISVTGESFTNTSGTLTEGVDYTINNKPSGLTPTISVAADGKSATLTFDGSAVANQDTDDISSLQFTFSNSAFSGNDASAVENAISAESSIGIDFDDNPSLVYAGSFTETSDNNGDIEGSATVEITGDTFVNAGGTLTYGVDYTITNLPSGLVPNLAISGDGLTATLTLGGSTGSHLPSQDIASLTFNFTNSAFTSSSATAVIDATNAVSDISISFDDNSPILTHGYLYDLENGLSFVGSSFNIFDDEEDPSGIAFSADGMKMFVVGFTGLEVNQYSLVKPFDVNSGVSNDGTPLNISSEESFPTGIAFSNDGSKMFITGHENEVNQYALSTAFDITSGVTHNSTVLDVSSNMTTPKDMVLSDDGLKLFLISETTVFQFTLNTAFDVTAGATFNSSYRVSSQDTRMNGIAFSGDGSKLFLAGTNSDRIFQYSLITPFDIAGGVSYDELFQPISQDNLPNGLSFNTKGDQLLVVGRNDAEINQYQLDAGGFTESAANDGSVTGEIIMRLDDDAFSNPGGTFSGGVEYIITNLPSSLSPLFTVAADGSTATLTLSGNATSNDDAHDVESLNIFFLDAAFKLGDNDIVANNGSTTHGLGVDFLEAPTFTSVSSVSFTENSSGVVYTAAADESVTFSLGTSKDEALFALANGDEISFNSTPDFEDPQDGDADNDYLIDVIAENIDGVTTTLEVTISVTDVDEIDPTFTSASSVDFSENGTGIAYNATADEAVTFSLGDSKDESLFTLVNDSEINFDSAPDFENPLDGNTDNDYLIDVIAEDAAGNTATLEVTITVTDVDEISPTFTSNSSVDFAENGTGVAYTAAADEAVTFSLGVSKDESLFTLANDDEISFDSAPDFENPLDGNVDNHYIIDVIAADAAGNSTTLEVTISVTDEGEPITWDGSSWSNGSGPAASDDVIIDGNYFFASGGSFVANNLTVNEGNSLIVNDNGTLTINGDITNNGGIRISAGSSLITFHGNSHSGNAIDVRRETRYVDGRYSFVGTPVQQNADIIGSDLGTSVYKYNESTPYGSNDGLERWEDASNDELIPGKGYTQAFKQELAFGGTPNAGTITFSGTYTEDTDDANEGWNLVANPYPAAINVADFLTENDNTTGAVYIWDDNGSDTQRGTNADYIVANASMASATSAGGQTRYNFHLGSAQGFFVQLSDGFDRDITFTEEMRVSGSNSGDNFFRETPLPIARINLVNTDGLFKQTVVGFSKDASENELNSIFDAKAFNTKASTGIFTLKAGRSLALNGMPSDWEILQLQVNVDVTGIYVLELELDNYQGMMFLRDNQTGELTDLRSTPYMFNSTAGIHTDRFELMANSGPALGLANEQVLIYAQDDVLHISQNIEETRYYQVFNLEGQQVLSIEVISDAKIDVSQLAKGIYLVFDDAKTHKVILK